MARLAFSYAGEAIHKRAWNPSPRSSAVSLSSPCDVTSDEDIAAAAALVKKNGGGVDVLVHSVAFANREDLTKRFIETSRDGFATALNVSAYSLTALCHAFEPMLNPRRVRAHHDLLRRSEDHHQLQRDGRRQGGP